MRTSGMARSSRSITSAARFRFDSAVSRATRPLYDRPTSDVKQFPRPPRTPPGPPMKPIDFRSDTVTKPTPAMRRAMADAEVGDDVYGEDPTINKLEQRAAEIFAREAAIFVPTGSMGNSIAVKIHTQPGQEIICEERGHGF